MGVLDAPWGNRLTDRAIKGLGGLQTICRVLILLLYFVNYGKILVNRKCVALWLCQLPSHLTSVMTAPQVEGLVKVVQQLSAPECAPR